jgi:hypothetical protein
MSVSIDTTPRQAFTATQLTALYLGIYLIFWTSIPLLLGQEPPIDNFEQLDWALHPALGYAKHPPLPTLLLWVFERIAPAGIALTYVLGALQVACMLGVAWAVSRDSLGAHRAWLAALLITCISYYTLRMHFYNHNTALLCATAAAAWCTWRAVRGGSAWWWAGLGLAWAVGMLSKYQMVLGIACNVGFAVTMLRARPRALARGLALAGAIACVGGAPHLYWLVTHHFPTLDYAAGVLGSGLSWGGRLDSLLRFLASQLTRLAGLCIGLLALHACASQEARTGAHRSLREEPRRDDAAWFWRLHAFGPLLLMGAMALLGGVDLEMHWGTAYLWALPPWYLSTTRGARLSALSAPRGLAAIAAAQGVLMMGKVIFPDL